MEYPLTEYAKKCAGGWIDRCPAHDDRSPSLSIKETPKGKLLLYCFAGCTFDEIIKAAALPHSSLHDVNTYRPKYDTAQVAHELKQRISQAAGIWQETVKLDGTLAQTYLNSRGIEGWSEDIRFHPNLYFSQTKSPRPAMVCAIRRDKLFVGVHRTFLDKTGNKLSKMMLGDCKGGAVYLGGSGEPLTVSEGVENGLAVKQVLSSNHGTFMAAMSATNLGNFKLPPQPATLIIAADGDQTGTLEALKLGERAAGLGWTASTLPPPSPGDWNDYLQRGD
jgi:phage/plasmid primase-like uncharacterized protein